MEFILCPNLSTLKEIDYSLELLWSSVVSTDGPNRFEPIEGSCRVMVETDLDVRNRFDSTHPIWSIWLVEGL